MIPTSDRIRGNIPRILWMRAAWMFLVIIPVIVPFYHAAGLSMAQVYGLQAVYALVVVAMEVPSGYLSDLLGRRRALIAAGILNGLGMTVLAVSDTYLEFVIFEVLVALGGSLFSGTDVALLYDSREAIGDDTQGSRDLGRQILYGQVGETVASLLGGVLVLVSLRLPAIANAVTGWIPLFIALSLVEPPRPRLARTTHRENMQIIWTALFGHSRLLTLILLGLIVYGLATLLAVWAFQGYWANRGVGLAWFGVLWAAYNLTVALTGRVASRVEATIGHARSTILIATLPVIGYFGMAAGGAVLGVLAGFAFQVSRGLNQVILRHALNSRVTTELRATANSVSSLGVRLSFAALGPILGWLIDHRSYEFALSTFGGLYAVLLVVLALPLAAALRTPPSEAL